MVAALRDVPRRPPAGALHHDLRHRSTTSASPCSTPARPRRASRTAATPGCRRRARRRAGRRELEANVLNADEFGVWVTGVAPVRDGRRRRRRRLTVDLPAVESPGLQQLHADLSRTLASMLQAAALRFSRAELEAISDGLTGLYNHRYLHERLDEELDARPRRGAAARRCCSSTSTGSRPTTTPRPQGRRRGAAPRRPHHRGVQPADRPGGPLRRRGVRARAGRHRRRRRAARWPSASAQRSRRRARSGGRRSRVSIGIATFPGDAAHQGRAARQGRLGDVCGQARRPRPGARLLRRARPRRPGSRGAAGSRNACQAGPKPRAVPAARAVTHRIGGLERAARTKD